MCAPGQVATLWRLDAQAPVSGPLDVEGLGKTGLLGFYQVLQTMMASVTPTRPPEGY